MLVEVEWEVPDILMIVLEAPEEMEAVEDILILQKVFLSPLGSNLL